MTSLHRDSNTSDTSDDENLDSSDDAKVSPLKNESQSAARMRGCVALMLLISGCTVTTATYVLFAAEQNEVFRHTFRQAAYRLQDSLGYFASKTVESFLSESETITSYAVSTNASWPQLEVPHFQRRSMHTQLETSADLVAFATLVSGKERSEWEKFVFKTSGLDSQLLSSDASVSKHSNGWETSTQFSPVIFRLNEDGEKEPQTGPGPYAPIGQISPLHENVKHLNLDLLGTLDSRLLLEVVHKTEIHAWSKFYFDDETDHLDLFLRQNDQSKRAEHPSSMILMPVYDSFQVEDRMLSAVIVGKISWDAFLLKHVSRDLNGLTFVVSNTCGQAVTYRIKDNDLLFVGTGDMHDTEFGDMCMESELFSGLDEREENQCGYSVKICPTREMKRALGSDRTKLATLIVSLVYVGTAVVFTVYIYLMSNRENKALAIAEQAHTIIASLFPSNVRGRLLQAASDPAQKSQSFGSDRTKQFKMEAAREINGEEVFNSKPIADLFPEATVLFGDIAGFTAWSSAREPSQVFQLLETIYYTFDKLARRRGVFKVETIGDCYVAVTGVPSARSDHAVVMTRFARECLHAMTFLTQKMELILGPETGELSMRFGIHSGPVTAGVLRGERSRFQLFGDTVNTAARMESTGDSGRIHISLETAEWLLEAGKDSWCTPRADKVVAKGKGELQTYWVLPDAISSQKQYIEESLHPSLKQTLNVTMSQVPAACVAEEEDVVSQLMAKNQRLIDWNVERLHGFLREIEARRQRVRKSRKHEIKFQKPPAAQTEIKVFEEVKEVIAMPDFDAEAAKVLVDAHTIELDDDVLWQLHDYVTVISTMYNDNPFHCFEHASHVSMSCFKMLARVVSPGEIPGDVDVTKSDQFESSLHDYSYGITSDPLTQFAVVFSALIHDVDHDGVSNAQLVKEGTRLASIYKNQSVAEQNSVNIAWDVLMDPAFEALQYAIFSNDKEYKHFRSVVVNCVMATDIVDKELKTLRNARWDKAFSNVERFEIKEDTDRKATIVLEHLIQASDIAHTMQHWEIYQKWNKRLFLEMYGAYKAGRMETDPLESWYQGEIGFFDFYIIPLAKKLKDCGVFGVSCDEFLNYAKQNRAEWKKKGKAIVQQLKAEVEEEVTDLIS